MEGPLDSVEWIVPQRRRQHFKVALGAEDLEQVVPNSLESVIIGVHPIPSVPCHELDGSQTRAGDEP